MDDFLDIIESTPFEDDGGLSLTRMQWSDNILELVFDLIHGNDEEDSSTWAVIASNVFDYRIVDSRDDGLSHHIDDHVMLSRYTDKTVDLYFRGSCSEPEAVVGALYEAHVRCVRDWFEFEKYLNTEKPLSGLIKGGHGKLACGPLFLLNEYKQVLDHYGIGVSLTDTRPAKYWNGDSWVEFERSPQMIHFGDSYIVADGFEARQLDH